MIIKDTLFLSVIVPTQNRAALLDKMLSAMLIQTYPASDFEVIVVDNGSTDDTKIVCSKYEEKIRHFRYIYDSSPGLHVGRHAGLKAAKGEILVYADDDIRAFPTWLEGVNEAFKENPDVALVGGKNLPDFETPPPIWVQQLWNERNGRRACTLFSILDFGDAVQEIPPYYVWGCNFSIRKSVLQRIGGFHPDGMPKDRMQYRGDGESAVSKGIVSLGYKTLYHPKASVYHWVSTRRMTFAYVHKRAYRSGVTDSYCRIRYTPQGMSKYHFLHILRSIRNKKKEWKRLDITDSKRLLCNAYAQGYREGYLFHLNAVKKDPELRKWVVKENYLE